MTVGPHVTYVLVDAAGGRYAAMAYLSVAALRRVHPGACITLVCDPPTAAAVPGFRFPLRGLVDELRAEPADMPHPRARSFYLKTRLRDLLAGDFAYLDCDTLPVRPFADVFDRPFDLALVQDRNHHGPVRPVFPEWERPRMKAMGWEYPLARYFNAGVMYVRDTPAARAVAADWQARWHFSYARGDDWDQLALSCAIHTTPAAVAELPPAYNAMVSVHPALARGAKVLHVTVGNSLVGDDTLFGHLLRHLDATGDVDWPTLDRCVARDYPWVGPDWAYRLWHTGNRRRAVVRAVAGRLARLMGGRP
ncbi:glycosyltransferase family protein [Urbifossiella limnaea]|uniref:Nucleotide-diphospho-sugar transferase domain-containing protein n=1 Tax=Urbifossiella limnaea TaxID=2528023 RepID=A0A517XMG2_9BACT|nr:hypothetical protein [Urbifossiella limnaea]QDU18682.1 hypothetical protein ETAA1_05750 [Urbifossiella limnaea]